MKLSLLSSAVPILVLAASTLAQNTQQSTTSVIKSTGGSSTGGSTGGKTSTGRNTQSTPTPEPTVAITGGGESDTATGPVPTITGGTDATDDAPLTGLPSLTGGYRIIPASVPPTAGAPYMQQSTLPEGTVFIAVGAILGFLAMSVLLWRGLVAWSLHRSVKRASEQTTMSDTKSMFGQSNPPLYSKYTDRDSTIDLSASSGRGGRKSMRPTTAPGTASTASLFFSPTAGAIHNPGNRGSNYLPAGYYAAGSSAPANNQSHVTVGQGPSISLSNLAHQSQGYTRARSMANSPPESPVVSGESGHAMPRSSVLNLNRGYGGDERAPSAYLDDLFDANDGAPSHPPSPPHHSHQSGGRF